jgi:hypothetical protein
MLPPERDLQDRTPVWDCLQLLFMDTDVTLAYDHIVQVCAGSKYSTDEIEDILYNEVMPSIRFNMMILPAPEWAGFNVEWLKKRILKKHRFGRSRPVWFRRYTARHWNHIRPCIEEARQSH